MAREMVEHECEICEEKFQMEKYGQNLCPKCGTGVCYDNDVYRLMLNCDQTEILKIHAPEKKKTEAEEKAELEILKLEIVEFPGYVGLEHDQSTIDSYLTLQQLRKICRAMELVEKYK